MFDLWDLSHGGVVSAHIAASRVRYEEGVFWLVTAKFGNLEVNTTARDLRTATGLALRDLSEKLLKTTEHP